MYGIYTYKDTHEVGSRLLDKYVEIERYEQEAVHFSFVFLITAFTLPTGILEGKHTHTALVVVVPRTIVTRII